MLIIDDNLKSLASSSHICSNISLVENFCIQVRLSEGVYYRQKERKVNGIRKSIRYGSSNKMIEEIYEECNPSDDGIISIDPGEQVLACSQERYSLPNNIFGLVQTKGTLARMFVQATCCDGQIEPGFNGKITLEIVNLSPNTIEIPLLSKIAQLYLFNCSMHSSNAYMGKYADSDKPTVPNFNGF